MKLHVSTRGEGERVVLVHSSGMSGRQWRRLEAELEPRYRVVVPDLSGSGASPPPASTEAFHFAEDVAALVDVLRASDDPVHLVGHSYGGLLALVIAAERPELVRSLAVYDPVAFGVVHDAHDEAALADLARSDDGTFFDDATGGDARWFRTFIDYWNGAGAWDALPPPTRDGFLAVGRKVFLEVRSLLHDRTPLATWAKIAVPALVLAGERSPLAARSVGTRLAAALPRARLVTVAGAGHMGPLTHAGAVNEAIRQHLDATRAPA